MREANGGMEHEDAVTVSSFKWRATQPAFDGRTTKKIQQKLPQMTSLPRKHYSYRIVANR